MIWHARCSKCGDTIAVRTITAVVEEVDARLEEKGWRVADNKPICRACVQEQRIADLERKEI